MRCVTQDEIPLVIVGKVKGAVMIKALDEAASHVGLNVGMTLATARALHPAIRVAESDFNADHALLNQIADWCERYTPCIGLMGSNGLVLDITGASHLVGGELALLTDIKARLTTQGFTAYAAIAGTAETARAIASFGNGGVVEPGMESQRVAPLPLAALEIEESLLLSLSRLGLKHIGDVANHPRAPLVARFGQAFMGKLDRIHGHIIGPISPRRPLPAYIAERNFAEPIGHEDDIHRSILTLAADIARLLEKHGEGGRCYELTFFRTDGAVRHLTVETARPLRDPKGIMRLFREKLDALADPLDPGFGFDLIRLSATRTERHKSAEPSFDGRDSIEEELSALIDRLCARFGTNRVMRLIPRNTHIPERAMQRIPAQHSNAALALDWDTTPAPEESPTRPIRLIDPPEPIEVIAEVPDSAPIRFRWRRVFHVVVRAEGPERIASEWWRSEQSIMTRDYFRIEDEVGHRFWVYREGLFERETTSPKWFMHGLFG